MPTEFVVRMSWTNIKEANLTLPEMVYTGQDQYVNPLLIYQEQRLTEGTDYEISGTYKACDAGKYSFIITGKGAFTGSVHVDYSIDAVDCKTLGVSEIYRNP